MFETLVSIEDPHVRDVVRTALRGSGSFRPSVVPRNELVSLVSAPHRVDLVVVDFAGGAASDDQLLSDLRSAAPGTGLVLVMAGEDRAHLNKAKLELNLVTVIPTPVDPFDLARRIHRIQQALAIR